MDYGQISSCGNISVYRSLYIVDRSGLEYSLRFCLHGCAFKYSAKTLSKKMHLFLGCDFLKNVKGYFLYARSASEYTSSQMLQGRARTNEVWLILRVYKRTARRKLTNACCDVGRYRGKTCATPDVGVLDFSCTLQHVHSVPTTITRARKL